MDFYGTIGPACAQPAILQHMVEAGMTGIRMNLSHGPLAAHTDWLAMIRAAGIRQLLIDLQGPELRIGTLAEPVALVEGSSVRLGADGVPCPAALVQAAAPGQQLLLDDGKLLVQVTQVLPEALVCTVVRGGTLQSRKSIAAPGLAVPSPTLTEEDLQNLKIAKQCGVTGVMLPFVRGKADILALRHALEETPAFQQHVDTMEQGDREGLQDGPKVSFKEIATKHWRSLLTCIGLVISTNVTYYMLLTYMPSYLSHNLHYSEDHGVLIIIAIMVGMLFVQPVIGMLSDRFGRRPFILIGSVALFALSIPAFIMINSNVTSLIFAGLLLLAVVLNCFIGVMASSLPAMFPTHIRFSALASAFNISVLIAGLTPTLAAWLVETTQNLMMPAYYLMVIAVVGMATGLSMKETANRPLKGATPAASDIQEAKEILGEHYDNIEQKIEDIDQEIADLQAKRSRLVQQHPRIND